MKQTSLEFISAEMERLGESGVKTAKKLNMSQPGFLKAMQNGVGFRIENFVAYCNASGYEVVVMPKEYVGILNDSATIITG